MEEKVTKCSVSKKCGSCQYQGVPYKEQLAAKQKRMKKLLGKFANVKPIIGMDDPFYYRNKVHAVFDRDKKGNIICGTYEAKTHKVVPIEECMIEDKISQEIIRTIRGMLKSFKITWSFWYPKLTWESSTSPWAFSSGAAFSRSAGSGGSSMTLKTRSAAAREDWSSP